MTHPFTNLPRRIGAAYRITQISADARLRLIATKHPSLLASRRRQPLLSRLEDHSVFAMATAWHFQKFTESE
jgi:hypothetical protein